jgi:hypothetical protein
MALWLNVHGLGVPLRMQKGEAALPIQQTS